MKTIKPIGTYKKYFENISGDCICKCSNCNEIINDNSVKRCPNCKEKFVDLSRGNRATITFVDEYEN